LPKKEKATNYDWLLQTRTGEKWNRIGIHRRAGVCIPLFSVYSGKSIGTGEIPDIRLLIDWCRLSGLSILQLLPLNELGYDFSPYNSISTFALEPMFLALPKLLDVDLKPFKKNIAELSRNFPAGTKRVNLAVKQAKIDTLRKIFANADKNSKKFLEFKEDNMHWLRYYALFRVITDLNKGKEWMNWDIIDKYLSPAVVQKITETRYDELEFYYWIQWQLFEQMKDVSEYAKKKGVLIMGDLPFLVARNSADVWAYKNYFKLHLSSGAPPDMYFARGQKWGMPPYDWGNIRADHYSYLRARLKYAENFYDLYRIDHFIGLFRLWTINAEASAEAGSMDGEFDPQYEQVWSEHGREIINIMNECTTMLPCAEDLGTVPDCSDTALREFGITGMNVQRWEKKWAGFSTFLPAEDYRENSNAVISTHDSSSFPDWFEREAGTVDRIAFTTACEKRGLTEARIEKLIAELFERIDENETKLSWKPEISNVYKLIEKFGSDYSEIQDVINIYLSTYNEKKVFLKYLGHNTKTGNTTTSLIKKNLKKIFDTKSIFSIQLLMEYLFLDKKILNKHKFYRINSPGTISDHNWSAVIPVSLNDLMDNTISSQIKNLVDASKR
jgi:4-alpha-glucanotransferase